MSAEDIPALPQLDVATGAWNPIAFFAAKTPEAIKFVFLV